MKLSRQLLPLLLGAALLVPPPAAAQQAEADPKAPPEAGPEGAPDLPVRMLKERRDPRNLRDSRNRMRFEPGEAAGPAGRAKMVDTLKARKRPHQGAEGAPGTEAPAATSAPAAATPAPAATPPPVARPTPSRPPTAASSPASAAASSAGGGGGGSDGNIDFAARAKEGQFHFDFNKAEIDAVVKAISDITRRNFIIPEKIKGQKLTILCPTRVTADEAYRAFLSALEINGLTIVRSGKFYKLMAIKDAIKAPIPTYLERDAVVPWNDAMVTILLRLKYLDANEISNLLKNLVSNNGQVVVYAPTNTLILSDYGNNIHRIQAVLDKLDQEGGAEELRVVPIEYATATEIADKLRQIFDLDKKTGAQARTKSRQPKQPPPQPDQPATEVVGEGDEALGGVSISKIIPDDRTNQLIVIAGKDSFAPLYEVIAKLDVPLAGEDEGQIRVYYLKNADAEELSNTLSNLASGKPSGTKTGRAKRTGAEGEAKPAAAASASSAASSATLFEGEVKITADKPTNSLVIVSSPRDYRSLRKVIDELDRPRLQVYVEAAILEVNVSDSTEFGAGWHAGYPLDRGSGTKDLGKGIGFLQSSKGSTLTPITDASSAVSLLNTFGGSIGGVLGEMVTGTLAGVNVTIPSFGFVLKALQSTSNANIISTPHILTSDNEEAEIEVGTKIPFQRGMGYPSGLGNMLGGVTGRTGSSSMANYASMYGGMFSSTDRIDVSLKLTITPHVNEAGKVRMEVDLQIEDLVGKDEGTGQPITATRKAKTVVSPSDQQTVVIGGLIRDRMRESEGKVPLLGDIPLLGWLFKTRSHETEKVNLLLVLTPYVVRDKNDFRRIFARKMEEHKAFTSALYGGGEEYRAHIEYARKSGPLALIADEVRRELLRYENGGSGDGGELLITPSSGGPDGADQPGGGEAGEQGDLAPPRAIITPEELEPRGGARTPASAPTGSSAPPAAGRGGATGGSFEPGESADGDDAPGPGDTVVTPDTPAEAR